MRIDKAESDTVQALRLAEEALKTTNVPMAVTVDSKGQLHVVTLEQALASGRNRLLEIVRPPKVAQTAAEKAFIQNRQRRE